MSQHSQLAPATVGMSPVASTALTLADALAALETWSDLTPKRAAIIWAINLGARHAGLPPASAPLTAAFVHEHLLVPSPAALAIKRSSRSNAASLLRLVLVRFNLIDREPDELASDWARLLGRFKSRGRAPFIRFAKFATLHGIAPEAVNDVVFAEFNRWVSTRVLIARPARVAGTFRRAWNAAVTKEPAWPQAPLQLRQRGRGGVIPFDRFPATFQQDVDAFLTRMATADRATVFSEDMSPEPAGSTSARGSRRSNDGWRPDTRRSRRDHIRWAAGALVASGTAIEEVTSLACLVQPFDHPRNIMRHLYRRAGEKPSAAGQHVLEVLNLIARRHVHLPEPELKKLTEWRKHVKLEYKGMTEANETLIRALLEPRRYKDLLRLPFVAMERAELLLADDTEAAVTLAMRALAVQLLLSLPPLRLKDLIGLRLDTQLQRGDPRSGVITHLLVPASQTKNRRTIAVAISPVLADMLELWIRKFRPHRNEAGNTYLFPGVADQSITRQGMRDAVKAITHEVVGIAVSPHKFRHLNAVSFLKKHPGQYELAAKILNHADGSTATRQYVGVERDEAHAAFDAFNADRQGSLTTAGEPRTRGLKRTATKAKSSGGGAKRPRPKRARD